MLVLPRPKVHKDDEPAAGEFAAPFVALRLHRLFLIVST